MDWDITELKVADIHSFWVLFKELLESEFPGYSKNIVRYFLQQIYSESTFTLYLQTKQKMILVAKHADEIAGFAVIDQPYGGVSLCRWLGVKQKYQKQGIGKKLIEKWLQIAQQEGCHKAEVASQHAAKDFYEKAGLTLEGKRLKSYFGIDQYIFGIVLGPVNEQTLTQ